MSDRVTHMMPDLMFVALVSVCQLLGAWWILRGVANSARPALRRLVQWGAAASLSSLFFAFFLRFDEFAAYFPAWLSSWARGLMICWSLVSVVWIAGFVVLRYLGQRPPLGQPQHDPSRRHLLTSAGTVLVAAPVAALGYGVFIQRKQFALREQKIVIPNLPQDLDNLRLVQLTDIHLSPFLSKADLERAVAMANETKAHVALVTGDLITRAGDPLDDCLDALQNLRADAGVFGCMGNHEQFAGSERYTEVEGARRGMRFLRQAAHPLRFGSAIVNLAGVDYQPVRKPYLVGAEKLTASGALNIMLSHNPDVFPVAAKKGFPLTIGGHTHGGQVRVEILGADLNVARFYTPFVDGLYRDGSSSVFVSRGIGTIGVPARLGAPPEVALIRLCRS
ncbi:MAG: metallophosphoesterase [Bryobacteraceae bacterium]